MRFSRTKTSGRLILTSSPRVVRFLCQIEDFIDKRLEKMNDYDDEINNKPFVTREQSNFV
jgi:hypothetical protein